MHKLESKSYASSYSWISHTNEYRLDKFIKDENPGKVNRNVFHTMPNYPSKNWVKEKTQFGSSKRIRLVYVGSLGFDTMYLKEVTHWVKSNETSLSLDIYSHNLDDKSQAFLQNMPHSNIQFHGAFDYESLPVILKNYDVGLVIYKPIAENWIYNAPNKVFEYLACGLDVWFSKTMTYTLKLTRDKTFPKIIPVDFEKLDQFDFRAAVSRKGLAFEETNFYYEDVYPEIYEAING